MPLGLEKKLVEEWVIEKLKDKGWHYPKPEELKRRNIEEPLLIDNLKRKILEINKNIPLTEEDLRTVINKLQLAFSDQNGHKEILRYFKYGIPIKTEKERVVRNIQLFAYENSQMNEFIVTNQFEFLGREKIRLDILLFVNGIPLVNIECKNPYTYKYSYYDAYRQIKRYEKVAPELYKYIQIGIGFAEIVKYFPIVPWLEEVKQEVWRWEGCKEEEAIFEMLTPKTLLDILKNFIFVWEFRGEMTKVIARYMQYRAANKIYQRVRDNLDGKTDKNKGLIWHWQGSGKTLTMIFSAHKLYFEIGKPTIFFIVDRRDLETQFAEDFLSTLDLNFKFEKIESIKDLREVLIYDDYKGKRGVFLTLIHKFNLSETFILEELEKFGEINKRKDVICFLDEVHRTQYGTLAMKMKNVLKNGFFFGFTGTPIAYQDRNTYKNFGYIDEKEFYLDKYFIEEAEGDGFIVPIVYELRKEEIRLKDEDLEWYLKEATPDDISDELDMKDLEEEIRKKINEITVILENPKNIEIICQDIAKHFKDNFDGKFKGLIVAASRKACVRFKNLLDKYLPSEYSEVVMSYNVDDEEEIMEYKRNLTERFNINDTDEINKKIKDKFKKEEYPKILIVTNMLITGFNEEKLAVLYLYKLLKRHRLLQTMARVNRPFKEKPAGLLVDYVGIFKYIEEALKFYQEKEAIFYQEEKVIKDKIIRKEKAEEKFKEILNKLENLFKDLIEKFEKEFFDKAIDILRDRGDDFVKLYQQLRKWFEFLKSEESSLILENLVKYKWLTCLYEFYYKKLFRPDIDETKLRNYFEKTIAIIHELIEPTGLKPFEPKIIDLNYVKELKASNYSEKQKLVGILNALSYLCVLNKRNPIYKSIAERVREIVERWQGGEDILNLGPSIYEILNYVEEKESEREKIKLNDLEFGIKLILEKKIPEAESLAKEIYKKIEDKLYPDWYDNPAMRQEVEGTIRWYLAKLRGKYQLSWEDHNSLAKEIYEYVKEYEEK